MVDDSDDTPEEPMFFDRTGEPIDLKRYLQLHADHDYRFLARDIVGRYEVVTAWLGIDQGPFVDMAGPLIFGTVALSRRGKGRPLDDHEQFAASEAEARAHHEALVRRLRGGR